MSAAIPPSGSVRLGATPDESGTTFALWSDTATAVDLCLIDSSGFEEVRVPLTHKDGPVWSGFIPGVTAGQRYGFRVHGDWNPQAGMLFNPNKLLIDPYAHRVTGKVSYSEEIYGNNDMDSAGFVPHSVVTQHPARRIRRPNVRWDHTIIYEAHVRGLTQFNESIPAEMRGTYEALGHPSTISYLKSLGITSLELLPIHHFLTEPTVASRGRENLWGYNPIAFSAPYENYSHGPDPISELQGAVDALHESGIEVLLDVVYNHTAEGGATGPILSMKGIDNRAYYRLDNGHYVDLTGCGNTINSSSPYVTRFVADSLRWWAEVIGVDGFRFDLLSAISRDEHGFDPRARLVTAIAQDPVLRELKLIAEPWDVSLDGYGVGTFPEPWREWNDKFRDETRSFWLSSPDAHPGVRDIAYRIAGSSDIYGRRDPTTSINFITSHDGFTMHDLVSWNEKHNELNGEANQDGTDNNRSWNCGVEGPTSDGHIQELRRKLHRSLMATLVLSAGIPMLTMGDEVGRSQQGSNNAYTLGTIDDWSRGWALPWQREQWQEELLDTTKALIQQRKQHPLLTHHEFFSGRLDPVTGRRDIAWFGPDGNELGDVQWHDANLRTFGYHVENTGESLLVLLHAGANDSEFTLPGEPWAKYLRLIVDTRTTQPVDGEVRTSGGNTITIASHSLQVWVVEN